MRKVQQFSTQISQVNNMHSFAYSVLLVTLLGSALVCAFDRNEAVAKFMEMAEQCKGEVGATDADVQSAMKHDSASNYETKCLRACVMKRFNVLNADGKLDTNAGREKAKQYTGSNPDKLKLALEIGDTCAAITVPDDHCEAAEAYSMCFKTEAHKHGLM